MIHARRYVLTDEALLVLLRLLELAPPPADVRLAELRDRRAVEVEVRYRADDVPTIPDIRLATGRVVEAWPSKTPEGGVVPETFLRAEDVDMLMGRFMLQAVVQVTEGSVAMLDHCADLEEARARTRQLLEETKERVRG